MAPLTQLNEQLPAHPKRGPNTIAPLPVNTQTADLDPARAAQSKGQSTMATQPDPTAQPAAIPEPHEAVHDAYTNKICDLAEDPDADPDKTAAAIKKLLKIRKQEIARAKAATGGGDADEEDEENFGNAGQVVPFPNGSPRRKAKATAIPAHASDTRVHRPDLAHWMPRPDDDSPDPRAVKRLVESTDRSEY